MITAHSAGLTTFTRVSGKVKTLIILSHLATEGDGKRFVLHTDEKLTALSNWKRRSARPANKARWASCYFGGARSYDLRALPA
jgi:hypothetical protein